MQYKIKNNIFADGRQYSVGEIINAKEAKMIGMDNCEEVEGEEKEEEAVEETENYED